MEPISRATDPIYVHVGICMAFRVWDKDDYENDDDSGEAVFSALIYVGVIVIEGFE